MNSTVLNEFIDFVIETKQLDFNDNHLREFITTISNNSNDNFGISLNDVAKWLSVREKNLRERLYRDYIINVDYKIFSLITGRRPKLETYITTNTFKNLCLTSNSTQGKIIRQYFITIEEAYREYLTDGIRNRLRIDETDYDDKYPKDNPVRSYPLGPCVYVIKNVDRGNIRYKIGQTKNLNRRLNEHRREMPGEVDLILYELYEYNEFLESCIHSFLKDSQVTGIYSSKNNEMTEIFESDVSKIVRIINACKMFRQSSDIELYIDGDESYSTISDMFTSDESDQI